MVIVKKIIKRHNLFMNKYLLTPGHAGCSGCGQLLAARHVMEAAGPNTIVLNSTGCLEVTTTPYPRTAWRLPWAHSLFENSAALATGVAAALKYQKINNINVIAQAGDGGTFDIGFGLISGLWERDDNVLYVCYDNEAYMNCLSTSSLIYTAKGLKKITEIKKGDLIYAFNQINHKLVLKKCSGVFNNGIKKVFILNTSHHSIKATGNHPFLTLQRNGRGHQNELVWKRLEELKKEDEIIVSKNIPGGKSFTFRQISLSKKGDYKVNKINKVILPKKSNPELMKYLGIFVGDGWIREKRGEVGFAVPADNRARKILINLQQKIFESKLRLDDNYVYADSVNLAKFINSLGFGLGAKNKTIPSWVFTLTAEEKESFIEGLMLSDGYKFGRSWRYVSTSEDLLKRLRLLLQTMNFQVGKIHWQIKPAGTHCVYRKLLKDSHYGYICFSENKKLINYEYSSQNKYRNFFFDNEFFSIEKVKSIKTGLLEPTLDLRVEGEHNFIADGIVVHNTGVQSSAATAYGASTTTSPAGFLQKKKNMPEIAMAHNLSYVATATVGNIQDMKNKVKKALAMPGAKYLQILCPCTAGWKYEDKLTIKLAKLAQQTGIYPVFEAEYGKITNAMKVPKARILAEEYLKPQKRFSHLFKKDSGKQVIAKIQALADGNIDKYNLI